MLSWERKPLLYTVDCVFVNELDFAYQGRLRCPGRLVRRLALLRLPRRPGGDRGRLRGHGGPQRQVLPVLRAGV